MADTSAKSRGLAPRADTRSQELTKNVVTTRMQLENHFKSLRRRQTLFRQRKLHLLEPQLKAAERMSRPATVSAPKSRGAASPTALGASADYGGDTPRSLSSAPRSDTAAGRRPGLGFPCKATDGSASRLDRCWSSPADFHSPTSTARNKSGGSWQTQPVSPGMSCHRASASVPVSSHPPSHPGAASSRPTVARPMRSFSATASPASPASRASGAWIAPGSPATAGATTPQMVPTPEGQSIGSSPKHSRQQPGVSESMRSFTNYSGATSPCASPSHRRTSDRGLLPNLLSDSGDLQEEILLAAMDAEDDPGFGGASRRNADPPETIERLGELMALLGPRYKTLSREVLWQRAEKGDMTPAQRKLFRAGGHGAGVNLQRSRPSSSAPALLGEASDPDGKARGAWLTALSNARALQRKNERKERSTSSGTAYGSIETETGLVDGASAGKAAMVSIALD